jgi:hypothetical protein
MTTYGILNSAIPATGRALTSAEVRALRAAGLGNVPSKGFVVQDGGADFGRVYRPVVGGMSDAGIRVRTR